MAVERAPVPTNSSREMRSWLPGRKARRSAARSRAPRGTCESIANACWEQLELKSHSTVLVVAGQAAAKLPRSTALNFLRWPSPRSSVAAGPAVSEAVRRGLQRANVQLLHRPLEQREDGTVRDDDH
eukprot:136942-Pyramimonas_sp.AAC.1